VAGFSAKPIARRARAHPERPYGFHSVEILAALVNGVALIGLSLFILFEAYQRLQHPPEVGRRPFKQNADVVGIPVAALGL
jgi:Co/Zn/Cd efflux system component